MNRQHAIVIGGSIAGLLAARVLSDYFSSITIVEKDRIVGSEQRKGIPQSFHSHTLFAKGYRILNQLFDGLEAELLAKGALKVDWVRDYFSFTALGWSVNVSDRTIPNSDIISVSCSRLLLESIIRDCLLRQTNIQLIDGCKVQGFLYESGRITGIRLQDTGSRTAKILKASLVVDASGRTTQSPKWLEEIGLMPLSETVVNAHLGYATCLYEKPSNFQEDWKVLLIAPTPPHQPKAGYLAQIEGNKLICTLGGYGKDFPATDEQGFLSFAKALNHSKLYEVIRKARSISSIHAYRATANRLRHFDRVKLPQGFIVLGDAVCSLCPIYGQGMTTSALGAMVLKNWLNYSSDSSLFQAQLARELFLPWTLATTNDFEFPTTEGERTDTNFGAFMKTYTQKLGSKVISDPSLHHLALEVGHLLRSPLALFHPSIVIQALF